MERTYYCATLSGLYFNLMYVALKYSYAADKLPPSQFRRDAIAKTVHHLTGTSITAKGKVPFVTISCSYLV